MKHFKYSYLSTKIRAMTGKMLDEKDYAQMQTMNTVRDVALYLKNQTIYSEGLKELDENDVHRGKLEILLYRALITDALKVARYLKGNERLIYRFVYRKQEIEDIKKMLRTLAMGRDLSTLDRRILFISRQSRIDFNVSLQATTIRELVDSLEGTNFHGVLDPLVEGENSINLFTAETALDLYYYNRIFTQIRKFYSGKDAQILKQSFGYEADFKNILWVFRGKKFYNLRKEVLYSNAINHRYKLKKEQLAELVEATTEEGMISVLKTTYLADYIDFDGDRWETDFLTRLGHLQLLNMRLDPFSIAPIIGYVFLKEMEIQNITTIIEGVRYKQDPSQFEQYIAKLGH